MEILRKTALENNKKYIGEVVKILVEGKNKKGEWYGKTRMGKNVKVRSKKFPPKADRSLAEEMRSKKNLIGEFVDVKIEKVRGFGLEGELV